MVKELAFVLFGPSTDIYADTEVDETQKAEPLSVEELDRLAALVEGKFDDDDRQKLRLFVDKRFTPEDRDELMAFMESKFSGRDLEEITRLLDIAARDGKRLQEKEELSQATENFGIVTTYMLIIGALVSGCTIL